jgi:alkanesulfonate monooxygenase SsuD/methylene tetrahydromethanopterin reductase-like flavin-dependent oxidoreductase (luciferase family)
MAPVLAGADRGELERRAAAVARLGGEYAPDPAASLDGLPATWIVGSAERIAARLCELAALGVDRVMLEATAHNDLEMIDLIGREVLPVLRPAAR